MKSIKEINQAALDKFYQNEFWRKFYDDAPMIAKELIEDGFRASLSDDENDDEDSNIEDRLTIDDIRYLAERGYHPSMRKHYAELLEKKSASQS